MEFIRAVQQKGGDGFQAQVGLPMSPKTRFEQLFEKCLAELTDNERELLDRMIDKMRGGLPPSPPGAAVP
jgi:hypothetical protein